MRASDGDGDFSLGAAALQVADGLGHVGELEGIAHNGREVTGLDVLAQRFEVSLALVSAGDVHGQPLGNHRRKRERTKLPPDPGPLSFAARDNEVPLGVRARRSRERWLLPPMSRIRS